MALTDDAKTELAEAIRIVREDRFEKYVRERTPKQEPPKDPPKDPTKDPLIDPEKDPKDPPNPPPPKDPPDPNDPPKGRKSAWWGELMDDKDD